MDVLWFQTAALSLGWALVCLALVGARHRLRWLHIEVSIATWRTVIMLTILALAVRVLAPAIAPPWMVGWTNMEQGRGILLDHRTGYCLDGMPGSCRESFPFYTAGYPFLIALSFFLFGISDLAALAVTVATSVLSVPLAFLFVHALLRREGPAVLAALLVALMPLNVAYSLMVRNEVPSVAVELLALWACLAWMRRGGRWTAFLCAASTALYVQMRPENPAILLVMAALALARSRRPPLPVMALVVGLALVVPHIAALPLHLTTYELCGMWYADGRGLLRHFSPDFIIRNAGYLAIWINAWYLPLLVPALALLALVAPRHKAAMTIGLWFIGRLTIYLLHSFPYDPRYTINVTVPFTVLAALGARHLASGIDSGRRWLVPGVLALSLLAYIPYAYSPGFGQEGIADGHRTVFRTVHIVIIPLALAGLGFLSSDRRVRALAIVVLVYAAVVLPQPDIAGIRTVGVNAQVREAIAFEEEVARLMGDRVSGCTVVTERPFAVTHIWNTPVIYLERVEGIVYRVAAGECLYLYETRECADEWCRALHDNPDITLELLQSDLAPPPGVAHWLQKVTVYRIRPSV